jgi:hypothetical protein
MDGVDNDRNGFTDCGDFSCSMSMDMAILEHCAAVLENTADRCNDGVDNDNNGFTDCEDFSCSRSTEPTVIAVCASQGERTFLTCSDGMDNAPANGFVDCNDFSCRDVVETDPDTGRLRSPCLESVSTESADLAIAACSDDVDNDGDGFVDCNDWDCDWNPLTAALCGADGGGVCR